MSRSRNVRHLRALIPAHFTRARKAIERGSPILARILARHLAHIGLRILRAEGRL